MAKTNNLVVRSPYKNCTANDPAACRYHSKRFTKDERLASFKSFAEMYLALEENAIAPLKVIPKEPDPSKAAQKIEAWRETSKLINDELTVDERRALHGYTDEYGSKNISLVLRNPDKEYRFAQETSEDCRKQIANIDTIIDVHAVDTSTQPLWRGVDELGKELEGVQEGEMVTFPTYLSTSQDSSVATSFTKKEHPVIMRIKAKRALPLGNMLYDSEQEMLIARNKTFKVISIEENVAVEKLRQGEILEGVTLISLEEVQYNHTFKQVLPSKT